jgi:hypothetical protein
MAAVLPRSQTGSKQPKLSRSSEESCKKKSRQMVSAGGGFQHSLSGKSARELSQTGSHVSVLSFVTGGASLRGERGKRVAILLADD